MGSNPTPSATELARHEASMDLAQRFNENLMPFARLMGIEIVSAEPERIVGEITVRDDLCTRPPIMHGGAIMAFADTLGALGTGANLAAGYGTTTLESKTNFVSGARVGTRLRGEATPIHRGRRTHVWQTRITGEDGKLIAVVTQTQMVLEPARP